MSGRKKCAACCVLYRTAVVVLLASLLVILVTMDLFQHRYYRLTKILLTIVGQWPYQSRSSKLGFRCVLFFLPASALVPQILGVAKYRDDRVMLMQCITLYVTGIIFIAKLFSFMLHSSKRLKLMNFIRTNWQVWSRDREVNILHGYAEQGEKIVTVYTDIPMLHIAMMYLAMFMVVTTPVIPSIIDGLQKNGNAVKEFPYPLVYYNIDEEKYYFHLVIYSNISAYFLITLIISNDVILIIYVQHVCSIFSALGHKLQRIGNNDTSVETGENPHTLYKKDRAYLASCIERHNDAIEYADILKGSYSRTFWLTCGLGMVLMNILGLQILMTTDNHETTIRFLPIIIALMGYFLIECHLSQILIDHSTNMAYYIYNSQWYRLPLEDQRILQFMTMRSAVSCNLTAGKLMVLSVRTFWLVLKTSISFFGFVRSTQGL